MDQKGSVKDIAMVVIVLLFFGVMYNVWQQKTLLPEQMSTGETATHATNTTAYKTDSVCKDLGLPEGSYVLDDGVCTPREEHYVRVRRLSDAEYAAGDERQLVLIKNVYEQFGTIYIDADYVQWLSHSDGTCKIDNDNPKTAPKDGVPLCNPNGFLILSNNPTIRTFKLSPDVRVRLMEEFGNIPDLRALSPQELMSGRSKYGNKYFVYMGAHYGEPYYVPFQFILKGGEVLFIHQVYVP